MAQTRKVLWCFLGVLILDQCLAQQPPMNCNARSGQRPLDSAQYHQNLKPDGSISFMAGFVQNFLATVQRNPFPKELLQLAVNDPYKLQEQGTIRQVLQYEVGFLVCAAIGLLYIILLPLVGVCLACCRCCGNCGGRMYQEQCPGIHRWRRCLYWALVVTTLIILAGNACMFRSNQSMSVTVELAPKGFSNAMDNMQMYLSTLRKQMDTVINEGIQTTDNVTAKLSDLGSSLGTMIQNVFSMQLSGALNSMQQVAQVANRTEQNLDQLNSTLQNLQPKVEKLKSRVQAVKAKVNNTLQNPKCTGCSSMQSTLGLISADTSFTSLNLTDLQFAVNRTLQADLEAQGKEFLQSIPQRVSNMTMKEAQKIQQNLGNIKDQISQVKTRLPTQALTQVSTELQNMDSTVSMYMPYVERVDRYRWIVGLVLCCLVLLVVMCNALGLILGPVGLRPRADPTKRSSTATCGALFLMSGAGFSLLFGWILMILVLILFLLGGNVYTLLCVPIHNQQLFQIIETSGVIQEYKLSQLLQLNTNLSFSEVYSDCLRNSSLWTTLHLMDVVNLNDILNVSKYTGPIESELLNKITFSGISLLSPDLQSQLLGFSNMSRNVDLSRVSDQIKNFSNTNLNISAEHLEHLANSLQSNNSLRDDLLQEAIELRQIQSNISVDIMPGVSQLNSTLQNLVATLSEINVTVGNVLAQLEVAQNLLDRNASDIVKSESRKFVNCLVNYFTTYTDWAKRMITEDVGCCQPVAQAVDSVAMITCSYAVESLNAFWFSLGWCMIFLIPSIVFSIKLAKYYRRMKYSDVFEDEIHLHQLPPNTLKF